MCLFNTKTIASLWPNKPENPVWSVEPKLSGGVFEYCITSDVHCLLKLNQN